MLYLEENGSRVATAKRIGVHPNTVANRIRTCRDILGRDVGQDQVPLLVALDARRHARARRPQDCAGSTGAVIGAGRSAQSAGPATR